ncbi:hypothetical protein ACIA8I_33380, partial [Streptomyces rishiriensis]
DQARPFKWTKTADQIIDRICRYCSRISEPAHYVFFVTGAPEPALLEAAARAAALPGVPAGAFAVVSDDPEAPEDPGARPGAGPPGPGAPGTGAGRGRRADLPPPPPPTS